METNELVAIVTAIAAFVNVLSIAYQAWTKNKPEIKKIAVESDSIIVDTANDNLEGAKISSAMLKERIDELKRDLDSEKKARRDDIEYFRRRVKDIEKEARDYRLWAARLAKQVIEVGKVPVPFISSLNDTDPIITAITREQEQLAKAKDNREAELSARKDE